MIYLCDQELYGLHVKLDGQDWAWTPPNGQLPEDQLLYSKSQLNSSETHHVLVTFDPGREKFILSHVNWTSRYAYVILVYMMLTIVNASTEHKTEEVIPVNSTPSLAYSVSKAFRSLPNTGGSTSDLYAGTLVTNLWRLS